MIRFTPWEAVVVAADIAVKSANVEIGFMDRFSGSLITYGRSDGSSDCSGRSGEIFLERCLALRLVQFTKVKTYEKSVILYRWCLCNCRNS